MHIGLDMPSETHIQNARRQAIIEVLGRHRVRRQAELVQHLQAQGLPATQSSVSRDLKHLGVIKQGTGYALPVGAQAGEAGDFGGLSDFVREIRTAGVNLTVLRTAVGAAQRVAVTLDRLGWPEIVGTLSGDDTIFIATSSARYQQQLLERLQQSFAITHPE